MASRITFQQKPTQVRQISQKKSGKSNPHQPRAIYANVGYRQRGESKLPATFRKVVQYVEANYNIPTDFEISSTYGVHSGVCYEKRLVAAYTWGQLTPKRGVTVKKLCVECGCEGHFRDDCETLIQ